jgi:hypothetical protein
MKVAAGAGFTITWSWRYWPTCSSSWFTSAHKKNFWCDVGTDAGADAAVVAAVDRLLQLLPASL